MNVKEYLKENILIFDGAMGTYYSQKYHGAGTGCELRVSAVPE